MHCLKYLPWFYSLQKNYLLINWTISSQPPFFYIRTSLIMHLIKNLLRKTSEHFWALDSLLCGHFLIFYLFWKAYEISNRLVYIFHYAGWVANVNFRIQITQKVLTKSIFDAKHFRIRLYVNLSLPDYIL